MIPSCSPIYLYNFILRGALFCVDAHKKTQQPNPQINISHHFKVFKLLASFPGWKQLLCKIETYAIYIENTQITLHLCLDTICALRYIKYIHFGFALLNVLLHLIMQIDTTADWFCPNRERPPRVFGASHLRPNVSK